MIAAAAAPAFDLAKIDTPAACEAGHEIELIYNGAKTGWFVTVKGDMAPSVKRWHLEQGNKFRMKEWREKRKGKADNPEPMTEADLELGLRGAAVRVAGFRGIIFAGQPFPFSEANAYELVRRHPPFADQILEESAEVANFS
ncbi:MAG: hypothetical protein ACYC0T_21330 [Ramlibacter sp.]